MLKHLCCYYYDILEVERGLLLYDKLEMKKNYLHLSSSTCSVHILPGFYTGLKTYACLIATVEVSLAVCVKKV
jgi:hypothetical protein